MTSSTYHVGFLFLDQMHHVYHAAPAAFELSADQQFKVTLFASTSVNMELLKDISNYYPSHRCQFEFLSTTFLSHVIRTVRNLPFPHVRDVLKKNRKCLMACDALVTTDKNLNYIMDRDKQKKIKYICVRHGAGDRAYGFSSKFKRFDLILAAGDAILDRMKQEGFGADQKIEIAGYMKFDLALKKNKPRRLFENNNPVVLYNPNPDRELSSWYEWGIKILEYFYNKPNINLIFAPHIMLFSKRKHNIPHKYYQSPNIHIDIDSKALTDMTYTMAADIYLGDVSSQIYEFIYYNPRPCIFLNVQHIDWKKDKNYKMWHMGDVIDTVDGLDQAVLSAAKRHSAYYADIQTRYMETRFSKSEIPAGKRAANAIAEFLFQNIK